MTLDDFLEKFDIFFYIINRLGCHFVNHFGGHLGFAGHFYSECEFGWLHLVGHSEKPINSHENDDTNYIIRGATAVFLYIP